MRLFLLLVLAISISTSSTAQSYKDDVFTAYFQRNGEGWIASDGTISVPLPDGRTLWLMGDAHIDQSIDTNGEIPCLFNTRSCMLVQDDMNRNDIQTIYNAAGSNVYERQPIQMEGDDRVTYWPAHGVVEGDTAYTFWTRYEYDTTEVWNLKLTGMVVAKIQLPELVVSDIVPIQYPEIEYGMSVVRSEEDGYYYIYGKYLDWIVFKPVLARCPLGELTGEWEFYVGPDQWSENPEDAIEIAPETAPEYSVFYLNGSYHLFYQENGYLQCGEGRNMYIASSPNPEGPFENPALVYTMQDRFLDTFPITYNAQAHPQFIENDELLISYNVNNICPSVCSADPFGARYDPDMYRPKFARVPLSMFTDPSSNAESFGINIEVTPNPSTSYFEILGSGINEEKIEIKLYDHMGVLIFSNSYHGSELTSRLRIDHHFSSGIYYLEVLSGDQLKMERLAIH